MVRPLKNDGLTRKIMCFFLILGPLALISDYFCIKLNLFVLKLSTLEFMICIHFFSSIVFPLMVLIESWTNYFVHFFHMHTFFLNLSTFEFLIQKLWYVDFIPFFVFCFGQQSYENTKILRNLLFILQGKTGKKK